jgi:acyl carrier protein
MTAVSPAAGKRTCQQWAVTTNVSLLQLHQQVSYLQTACSRTMANAVHSKSSRTHTMDKAEPAGYILEKIKELCPQNISDAELLQTRIIETGIDSLELMELIMEIEGEYNIEIADSQLSDDLTVSRFCDLVTTLCSL